MPLFSPDQEREQPQITKELSIVQLANGMVIKENEFANFELWEDGQLLGTYTHPEGVWKQYRERAFTPGDEIALHGLGVTLGKELPEPQRETLPWEVHAIKGF